MRLDSEPGCSNGYPLSTMRLARELKRLPFAALASALLLAGCETLDSGSAGTIQVEGRCHFPDGEGVTYRVKPGAEIIGAGGIGCTFVIEPGARLEAHSGSDNTYKIKSGGYFRGFAHPAQNCVVQYEPGAVVEPLETGPGTRFVPVR